MQELIAKIIEANKVYRAACDRLGKAEFEQRAADEAATQAQRRVEALEKELCSELRVAAGWEPRPEF